MAAARFELYLVRRYAVRASDAVTTGVTWRLLSTNNRDLGRAARVYPDSGACLDAVGRLRLVLAHSVVVTTRDARARRSWRLQVDGLDVAVSSRAYQRRVQSEYACAAFLGLASGAAVVHSPRLPQP